MYVQPSWLSRVGWLGWHTQIICTHLLPQRRRVEPQWEALGLAKIPSEDGEVVDSGGSSGAV